MTAANKKYGAEEIVMLQGLEHIRARVSMYLPNAETEGLHHLLHEAVDNAIDEFLDGHVTRIEVTLLPTGAIVQDNGRGIPVEHHPQANCSTLEAVFTRLHTGGKFKKGAYTSVTSGNFGVGMKATCALSSSMTATSVRDGQAWQQQYAQGKPTTKVAKVKSDMVAGVKVEFSPDPIIFGSDWKWQPKRVAVWLRDVAWLCPGLTILLTVKDKILEYHSEDGLVGLLQHETAEAACQGNLVTVQTPEFDVAWVWTDIEGEHWRSWVNVVNTPSHGTHVQGAKRAISDFLLSLTDLKLRGEDLRDGLVGAVHARVLEPKFQGQTKQRLENSEVEQAAYDAVTQYLTQHKQELQETGLAIIARAKRIQDARQKFRAEQAAIKGTKVKRGARGILPDKLIEAPDCTPEERELFIVEGDSAGGTVKKARVERQRKGHGRYIYQEIFQLRGKVANASRKGEIEDLLKNQEIKDLVTAIGTGVGDSFDLGKCRYGGIYLLADADPDGKHIVALLLSLFATHLPALIDADLIRVVQNPLFMGVSAKQRVYGDSVEEVKDKLGNRGDIRITRFKGLGESNASDLQIYALHPDTRRILQVAWDRREDATLVQKYMGHDAAARKEILGIVE
jgi:DNA gyrase subunit B